ncbi:MAG: response regulator transcription factor [Fimbriiglobus sp.]
MSKSKRLTTDLIRTVFRWVGDCRDLGHDCEAWNLRAADCLRTYFDLPMVVTTCMPDFRRTPPVLNQTMWDVGSFTDRERQEWCGWIFTERFQELVTTKILLTAQPNQHYFKTRQEIINNRDWGKSIERNEARRPLGQDEFVACCYEHAATDHFHCFSINRAVRKPEFSARAVAMMKLFHEELIHLFGTRLTMGTKTSFDDLPPRLLQVLNALLEGDTERQIALKLNLSRHTVHEHVTRLYRRLEVHNRAELLAAYYRLKR